ncbi:DAO domain-containing protein [Balamuthia mandrillaris]
MAEREQQETRPSDLPFWLCGDGDPLLQRYHEHRSTAALPEEAETVIIGGGLAGLSTAYWMKRLGFQRIVLVEQRGLCEGATGRNGGHQWPLIPTPSEEWLQQYGQEELLRIIHFDRENCSLMRSFITASQTNDSEAKQRYIDFGCDLVENGGLEIPFFSDEVGQLEEHLKTASDLLKELREQKKLTTAISSATEREGEDFEWWDVDKCVGELLLRKEKVKGGLYYRPVASFWPAKFVFALTDELLASENEEGDDARVNIQTQTEVLRVTKGKKTTATNEEGEEEEKMSFEVETSRGVIRAGAIVYATNAWTTQLLPSLKNFMTHYRGQILLLAPCHDENDIKETGKAEKEEKTEYYRWPYNLSFNDGYEYMIQRKDGRIVVGGRRWISPTMEEATLNDSVYNVAISNSLKSFVKSVFPITIVGEEEEASDDDEQEDELEGKLRFKVERQWTGIMGQTSDDFPLLGPLSFKRTNRKEDSIKEEKKDEEDLQASLYRNSNSKRKVPNGEYVIAGFCGDGMSRCFAAGKRLAESMCCEDRVGRIPRAFLPQRAFSSVSAS